MDSMDKVRFHAHFPDVSGLDDIHTRRKGELEFGCSIFIQRTTWNDPEKVDMRESAIQVPTIQRECRRRELTPAPCPGTLVDNEVTVDDMEWCLKDMKIWNSLEPYVTYCERCKVLAMKNWH